MPKFDSKLLIGTWDVIVHAGGLISGEQMVFDESTLKNYRDGSTTPYLDSTYSVSEDGMITVDGIGLVLNLCFLDSETALLVETHTGYAYELKKQE